MENLKFRKESSKKSFLTCYFTFSDLVTLPVCLGFDDVTFYESLHDFLQPVKMYSYQYTNGKIVDGKEQPFLSILIYV